MNLMINPSAQLNTEAEARTAARASAVSIFIGVVMGIVSVVLLMNGGLAQIEAAMQAQAGNDPEMAGMTGMMTQGALYLTIFMVVIQAVIGLVQWAKPNVYIPIIFLILVVYGLGTSALGLMTPTDAVPQGPMSAPAMVALSIIVLLVQALLHVVGIRGASKLSKLRAVGQAD